MGNQDDNEPRLIRIDSPEREIYTLHEGTNRIGRSRGFDICLEDTTVSRFHCYLLREGNIVRLFNGESKNPALLDGEPADGQTLRNGHALKVGRCEFVYEGPIARAAPPGAAAARGPARRRVSVGRRRTVASGQSRSSIGPILAFVLGFAALIGILIHLERGSGTPPGGDASSRSLAASVEESQRRIDQILERIKLENGSAEELARNRALLEMEKQRNAELRRELESERDFDRQRRIAAGSVSRAEPASARPGGNAENLLFPELDNAEEIQARDEKPGERGSHTVIVQRSRPDVKRTPREIKDLVARLTTRIDDYGTHLVLPKKLEPELTDLSTTSGKEAAAGVVQVYEHVRGLIRQTDASIAANEQHKEQLLRKAAQVAPQGTPLKGSEARKEKNDDSKADPKSDPKKDRESKSGMYSKPVGQESETNQRLLEAYGTAADIHRRHREFLLPLRAAVLESLGNLTDPEALSYLRQRFSDDTDLDLLKGALEPFRRAGDRESIPILIRRMGSTSDAGLKSAIQRAMASIAGQDLGDKASDWSVWWAKRP